ncbi:acyltransferase family protein [Ornithinibacillus salinisoli]|uniref:acyltransferase family protein n=1 Tax=Ornithinibacillus salinisoli TaxID=1848459 RepID=UPI00362849E0
MNYVIKRDVRIDILRALAIFCIILAHTAPIETIFIIRNFDVTLMAFLMGASFYLSNQKHGGYAYGNYLIKRFNRLVLPAWKFLVCFFILFYVLSLLLSESFYFSYENILKSFLMIQGETYMWILAVFFMVALVSPFVLQISNRIKSNLVYFIMLVGAYLTYHYIIIIFNESISNTQIQELFQNFIVNGIGYSLVAAIGIRLYKIDKNKLLLISSLFLLLFITLSIYHDFTPIQTFKYPPSIYYFSYGLFVSMLLFYLLSFDKIKSMFNFKFTIWLSTNSLLLYYYHTIPIYLLKFQGDYLPKWIEMNFVTRFIFLFGFALVMVFIHNIVKKKIPKTKHS